MITSVPVTSVFIDTNVWLYAFIAGQDPQKTQRAQHTIQSATSIIVSTQVINEVGINLNQARKLYGRADTRCHP